MYSKSWCPYCRMAKRLLAAKNASWREFDIEDELRENWNLAAARKPLKKIAPLE